MSNLKYLKKQQIAKESNKKNKLCMPTYYTDN